MSPLRRGTSRAKQVLDSSTATNLELVVKLAVFWQDLLSFVKKAEMLLKSISLLKWRDVVSGKHDPFSEHLSSWPSSGCDQIGTMWRVWHVSGLALQFGIMIIHVLRYNFIVPARPPSARAPARSPNRPPAPADRPPTGADRPADRPLPHKTILGEVKPFSGC